MTAQRIRVLCLHGFRTNEQVMRDQTKGMQQALGPNAEFVYVNGPFEADGASDPTIEQLYAEHAPFYEWWTIRSATDGSEIEVEGDNAQDTYFNAIAATRSMTGDAENKWYLHFDKVDKTLEYMDEQLRQLGPFDIVVGFSQGAVLLTILSMWYLKNQNAQWWKLAICVCGVRVRANNCRALFLNEEGQEILVPFPSIHIIGAKDPFKDEAYQLADMYEDNPKGAVLKKLVIEHDSGHKFPSAVPRNEALYRDLARVIHQHLGIADDLSVCRL